MSGKSLPGRLSEIGHKDKSHTVFNLRSGNRSALTSKEMILKNKVFAAMGDRFAKLAALLFCASLTLPALAQVAPVNMFPAVAASSAIAPLPKGVKVLAQVPLEGAPITRMYTQREYGHTFLYIEHGRQPLTTVDVTKKRSPRIVEHQPAKVEPVRYEPLFEGGSIENWPRHVTAGIDNLGGHGTFSSVLESSDPNDAKLLQTFVAENTNLADRDSRLVYFASRSQLLIVQDNRPTPFDLTNYTN